MSKQKVVSSLLLSTVVLGGLAFYSTTTVKAESLEPDVTSVNASDATNKPVVSNEEESDFLAEEEELEESDVPVETLNEEIKDVTEPEALLQPRAMMGNSTNSGMEEIPLENMESEVVVEKVTQNEQIQATNQSDFLLGKGEDYRTSVSIGDPKLSGNSLEWSVSFDARLWSFEQSRGGYYFILPKGLKLTSIKDNDGIELFSRFPNRVESSDNHSQSTYRFFSKEENGHDDKNFDSQWGWSVKQASSTEVEEWNSKGLMSKIFFIDNVKDKSFVTYRLTAERESLKQTYFPLVAVMKSFRYKNLNSTEITSLAGREIVIEKTKVQKPKEEAPKTNPEPEAPKPDAPQAPSAPESPTEEPKKEDAPQTPQAPSTPKDEPQAPSIPEEKPQVPEEPKPDAPETPDKQPEEMPKVPEAPKEDAPQTPQEPQEQPKETPEASPKPEAPQTPPAPEAPTEEPKKEEEPGQELPKPMEPKVDKPTPEVPQVPDAPKDEPQVPSIPEEQPKETPKPEVPSTPEKQPEAPKEEAPKEEVPAPEIPSVPEEKPMEDPKLEAPKEDTPASPAPSVPEEQPKETPKPEVPKQEDVQPEAPKSDKVESDK
ncbi:TPA: cell surface protein, partial [Streptococcus suis]|nr:cell surface protein [Streptococcus suis]